MHLKRSCIVAVLLLLGAVTPCFAFRGFLIPVPLPVPVAYPQPVYPQTYYAPAPVYYAPAPGYYAPAPSAVYSAPAPAIGVPAPFFYAGFWWWSIDGYWHRSYSNRGPWGAPVYGRSAYYASRYAASHYSYSAYRH